jgi:hypothetical protein
MAEVCQGFVGATRDGDMGRNQMVGCKEQSLEVEGSSSPKIPKKTILWVGSPWLRRALIPQQRVLKP